MSIAGKRIFVTGAANGCGEGFVREAVRQGARVFATDIADAEAARLLDDLKAGDALTYAGLDVSDRDAVFRAIDEAASVLGGLDGIVNAAGIVHQCTAETATMADFDRVFAIHVKGTISINQAALPHLRRAGGGTIVNFSSIAGIRGMPGFPLYGAAKGAVLAWTRNAALEWGADNIRVNAIVPAMESKMTRQANAALDDEARARMRARTRNATAIRGTLGDPERDLAPLIALLLSDGGTYITGQAIAVDGGMLMLGS